MADAIAGEGAAGVGRVGAPGNAALAQIALGLGAIDFDQRAHDVVIGHGADGGQTGGPGAAQETEEHGFGLIGAGVPGGDRIHRAGAHQAREEFQAGITCGLFQIAPRFAAERGHIGFTQFERQMEAGGQIAHERGIAPRLFAAKLMIQMQHGKAQIPAGGKFAQNVQQAYGIGAAGDRHAHALVRLKHAITGDRFGDFFKHSNRYSYSTHDN